ncbi:PIG-L family deacetylase [Arcanobacterium hippocoleae]
MKAAANCLGIEHVWLGFEDSGFPDLNAASPQKLPKGCFADLPLKEPVAKLVTQIRRFRPQVLTCYDENGGYPHPDHIRAHQTALASVAAAADPEFSPADGEPWKISKVYYDVTFSIPRMTALDGAMRACGLESNLIDWRKHEKLQRSKVSHAKINVADFFPQRDSALRAHQTQIDPDGFFFSVPRSIEAAVWPWEEFFLAQSAVGMPQYEEHDLFERIPGVAILP